MRSVIGFVFIAITMHCRAAAPVESAPAIENAAPEEITVTGEVPGPGLWKVMRPDDPEQHVLWILGDAPPLPKKMQWRSKQVEAVIANSQAVLLGPGIDLKPDERIGFFRGLSLLPAALGARKNPQDAKLEDLLPADEYARWLRLKKKYLGRDAAIERWRPIFAARKLLGEAFDDLRMRESGLVSDAVEELAKRHKIATTTPKITFPIKTREIKANIEAFSREPLADLECFVQTLDLVEAIANEDDMHARAFAWASGDIEALAAFAPLPNPDVACQVAIMGAQTAQQLIPSDINAQQRALWLDTAKQSLARNISTFVLLPFGELTSESGQLAALRALGYVVEAPASD